MGKDTRLLASISPKFTENTLWEILVKISKSEYAKVTGWSVEPAAAKGDNYLSIVHRVTIDGRVADSDVKFSIIVKALPRNKRRNEIFRSSDFFKNETVFYTQIVPLFEAFLKSKGKSYLLNVPKCFAYLDDGENNYLALEDAKAKGFRQMPRETMWGVRDCQLVFKALAQYHGVSLALWHQKPTEFANATKYLTEMMYTEELWNWYGKYFNSAVYNAQDAMSKIYRGTPQERKFNSTTAHELFNKNVELLNQKDKQIVTVNHGDAWSQNIMVQRPDSGEGNAIIFDFQLARCGSPVHDLANFIYTSTDKQTRDEHFHSLLNYYHTQLGNTLSLLGSNIEAIYSWDLFMKDVKEQFVVGFTSALETLPALTLPGSETFDADEATKDNHTDIADIWALTPIENRENLERVADVIMHVIEEGFL